MVRSSILLHHAVLVASVLVGAPRAQEEASEVAAEERSAEFYAPTLTASGFYSDTSSLQIGAGFVPYSVRSPLWTDGAQKDRFVRLPAGKTIGFRAGSEWEFPVGTTFLQTLFFVDEGVRLNVETRVITRGEGELHFGSYVWNDEGTDAELVDEIGDDVYANHGDVSQLWSVPPRDDCAQCHNAKVGLRTLGLTTEQWNFSPEGDEGGNQLRMFADRGLLVGVPDELAALAKLADPSDVHAPIADRARSYMATNCSACHRPKGEGSGTLDLRIDTPLAATGLLSKDLLGFGTPRSPGVLTRMHSIDWERMPSLLSTVPDDVVGIPVVRAWIESLTPAELLAPVEKRGTR